MCCICVALATSGAGSAAHAQENIFRAQPGAKQLGISGGFVSVNGGTKYAVTLEGGYYISDRLVALGRVGLFKRSPFNLGLLIGARYEFGPSGSTVPYIVGAAEFHHGSHEQGGSSDMIFPDPGNPNATFLQAGVGFNHFLTPRSAIFFEVVAFTQSSTGKVGSNLEIGLRAFFK